MCSTLAQKHMNLCGPTFLARTASFQDCYLITGWFVGSLGIQVFTLGAAVRFPGIGPHVSANKLTSALR
jgi:hypothetical protein